MEELRKQLVEIINNSHLPFEAIYYIMKDIFREVNDVYDNMLKQQQEKEKEQQEDNTVKDEAE